MYGDLSFYGKYPLPVEGNYTVTSEYGYRTHPITSIYKLHTGIDLVGPIHGNILSIGEGEVIWAGVRGAYGNCINIKHTIGEEVFYSFYAHLSRINVYMRSKYCARASYWITTVELQQTLILVILHGSHLHFEIRLAENGSYQNPRLYLF